MPAYPRAARFVFAVATDQGQPEGAKGVALHLLPASQATPFGEGMTSLFGIDKHKIRILGDIIEPLDVDWEAVN